MRVTLECSTETIDLRTFASNSFIDPTFTPPMPFSLMGLLPDGKANIKHSVSNFKGLDMILGTEIKL